MVGSYHTGQQFQNLFKKNNLWAEIWDLKANQTQKVENLIPRCPHKALGSERIMDQLRISSTPWLSAKENVNHLRISASSIPPDYYQPTKNYHLTYKEMSRHEKGLQKPKQQI